MHLEHGAKACIPQGLELCLCSNFVERIADLVIGRRARALEKTLDQKTHGMGVFHGADFRANKRKKLGT